MEEKQVKPKSTGKTVTIIILIVLLLGLGGYTAYDKLVLDKNTKDSLENTKEDLEIANREKKEANEKIKKLEKDSEEENTQQSNSISVYSYGYIHAEYSHNGEIYIAVFKETFDEKEDEDEKCDISNLVLSDDKTKSTDCYKVKKLNIKEKDINKIITTNNFYTSDPQQFIYVIYKNGSVTRYNFMGEPQMKSEQVLKDYKVKDLKVSCKGGWENCKSLTYKLTLLDGTEKTVKEK